MGADGWDRSLLYAVHQILSIVPCTVTVSGAAGHKHWESSRGGSLRRHMAGPLTVRLTPATTYCCRVAFNVTLSIRLAPGTRT